MHRRNGRTTPPQLGQFVAPERAAGVQSNLAFPIHRSRKPPRRPRNLAVRHAEPDHISITTRILGSPICMYLSGKQPGLPPRRSTGSRDDFAYPISRPAEFHRQRTTQSPWPHNRDAWFPYHRRSIAFVAPADSRTAASDGATKFNTCFI